MFYIHSYTCFMETLWWLSGNGTRQGNVPLMSELYVHYVHAYLLIYTPIFTAVRRGTNKDFIRQKKYQVFKGRIPLRF